MTFSESVVNVGTGNFTLNTTGVAGASVTGVSGSGSTRTVTVNTGSGDGTIRCDLTVAGTIQDTLGNAITGLPYTAGQFYTVNKTAPIVSSITRVNASPTNAGSVQFTVTFSEAVTGVGTADFALNTSGVSGASISGVSADTGATRTVTVNTGTGDGTIRLDLIDDDTVVNGIPTPLGGVGAGNGSFTSGEVYTIDKTGPTITAFTRAGASPTNATSVTWNITWSEAVTGATTSNFSLINGGLTGPSLTGMGGSGTAWTITANTGTGDGTLGCNITSGTGITDAAGNAPTGGTPGGVYTIDKTAPTVVSINRAGASPTNAGSVTWNVTFSEVMTSLATTNFTLANTGLTGPTLATVGGGGTSWTVSANTGTGDGTLGVDMTNSTGVTDAAGNAVSNLNFVGQLYTIDKTGPTITAFTRAGASPTNATSVTWNITWSEAVTGATTSNFTLINTGLTGPSLTGMGGSGTAWTITANTGTGDGTLGCNIQNGTGITDAAGNAPTGGTPGGVYTIDKTVPTITLTSLAPDPTNTAITVNATLSEASTNFDATDVSPTNGSVSAFSGSGTAYSWTLTASAQGVFSCQVAAGAFGDAAGNSNAAASNSLSRTFDSIAPSATLTAVADPTRVGTALSFDFTGTDASAITTNLWVRAPGAGSWSDTGIQLAGTSGTFNWTGTVGNNGLYQFAARSTDAAGNTEAVPASAETSVLLNTVINGAFTQTTTAASESLTFPMTDDLDMVIDVTGANIGGQVTVSRTTPLGAAPAGLTASRLIDEFLSISQTGLGAFTAQLTWNFDPASDDALIGGIDHVYRYESGIQTGNFAVTPTGTQITVPGITAFSDWYAGNNNTSVDDWTLHEIR